MNLSELRQRTGLSQTAFWGRLGLTQSAGSRYENGRRMPRTTAEMLRLVYIERVDLSMVDRELVAIIEALQAMPDLYRLLQNEVRARQAEQLTVETPLEIASPPIGKRRFAYQVQILGVHLPVPVAMMDQIIESLALSDQAAADARAGLPLDLTAKVRFSRRDHPRMGTPSAASRRHSPIADVVAHSGIEVN